jgi:hypothetical protein
VFLLFFFCRVRAALLLLQSFPSQEEHALFKRCEVFIYIYIYLFLLFPLFFVFLLPPLQFQYKLQLRAHISIYIYIYFIRKEREVPQHFVAESSLLPRALSFFFFLLLR